MPVLGAGGGIGGLEARNVVGLEEAIADILNTQDTPDLYRDQIKVRAVGSQQIPHNSTETTVDFDSTVFDPYGMWDGSSGIVIPVTGRYRMTANAGGGVGNWLETRMFIRKTGFVWSSVYPGTIDPSNVTPNFSDLFIADLKAGDVLELSFETLEDTPAQTSNWDFRLDVRFI